MYGEVALKAAPHIERLAKNLGFYREAQQGQSGRQVLQPNGMKNSLSTTDTTDQNYEKKSEKSVLWAILAKDAEKVLPLYLECLLNQTYSKKNIHLYIRTNDNKDATELVLSQFVEKYKDDFMGVHFDKTGINPDIKEFGTHEWNGTRFNILGKIRQDSVDFARKHGFDFYFVSDVDNFIMPDVLEVLVKSDLQAVAPMLRMIVPEQTDDLVENSRSSNFYFADKDYWFVGTPEYYEIMDGRKPGIHEVDLIHCTYLLRNDVFPKVDYLAVHDNWEYKNLIISLKRHDIKCFLDARKDYGVLTLSEQTENARFQLTQLKYLDTNWESLTETERAFNLVYARSEWGYRSGPGSKLENAREYIDYVNLVLSDPTIVNILEIGCGDFRVGRNYNLDQKKYLGIDVNATVIEDNKKFESKSIKFLNADFADISFAGNWDLILIKDVLQHLPNNLIKEIVNKILMNSKQGIICNDRGKTNLDIVLGGYRGIDLSIEPFNYAFDKVKEFGLKDIVITQGGLTTFPGKGVTIE